MYEDYRLPIDLPVNHPKGLSLSVKALTTKQLSTQKKERESEDLSYVDKTEPVKNVTSVSENSVFLPTPPSLYSVTSFIKLPQVFYLNC